MPNVPKLWPNSTITILATGPSLTPADVNYVRGKTPVICVNDAYRLAPWADVLYSSDRQWWPHHQQVTDFHGSRYGIGSSSGKANSFPTLPDVTVLANTGDLGLERDPSGLRNGRHSGYAAINLAVHFGAARIVLLGYTGGTVRGQIHFFGSHSSPLVNPSDNLLASFRRNMLSLVEPLAEAGVEVINCTLDTKIEAFPIADLRDTISASYSHAVAV